MLKDEGKEAREGGGGEDGPYKGAVEKEGLQKTEWSFFFNRDVNGLPFVLHPHMNGRRRGRSILRRYK